VPSILVVEDEPDLRELVRFNLELDGFEVGVAADGAEGLAAARSRRPDAILLDLMMPGIDGWEVLAQLKASDPALATVPVLLLTARAADVDRARGGIEGAVRYLTKPFDLVELGAAVAEVLAGGPEPVQRRQVQRQALSLLVRIEGGDPARPPATAARPRLSRLDGTPASPRGSATTVAPGTLRTLSAKQRALIDAIASSPTVSDAAAGLAVSRSNVYASLRRIARKLGISTVSDLVSLARAGGLT